MQHADNETYDALIVVASFYYLLPGNVNTDHTASEVTTEGGIEMRLLLLLSTVSDGVDAYSNQ